jgi:fructose-1,6-bisphosphatase/inositol monophosphatase family enzyme
VGDREARVVNRAPEAPRRGKESFPVTDPAAAESGLARLRELHRKIRDALVRREPFAKDPVETTGPHDFAFRPDAIAEGVIAEYCAAWAAEEGPIRVLTEESDRVFPEGASASDARLRLLVDPVDGTRVFLHDLRSAWTLSALARETPGREPRLLDACVALQTEIPTSKQYVAETLYTREGTGPTLEKWNILTDERISAEPLRVPPLGDPHHTFVVFSKFFPEGKGLLAWMEESILEGLRGESEEGRSFHFEDQYLSTGGQLWCLATGRYSFVAELRPLVYGILRRRGKRTGVSCHPHDIASLRIAADAGVRFTDVRGNAFDPPMNNSEEIGFLAYATDEIREALESEVDEILEIYRS